jgi:hypothetical protein
VLLANNPADLAPSGIHRCEILVGATAQELPHKVSINDSPLELEADEHRVADLQSHIDVVADRSRAVSESCELRLDGVLVLSHQFD